MKHLTRNKILQAATQLFARKGFFDTSVGDISRCAGISQGAMYNHFRSKDDLIVAIVNEETDAALRAYSTPYSGSSFGHLCELIASCATKSGSPVDARLWTEMIAEAARNPHVNRAFIDADVTMRGALKSIITQGIEKGEFAGIDPEQTSIILFAVLDGLLARQAYTPDFDLQKQLSSLPDVIARILAVPDIAK